MKTTRKPAGFTLVEIMIVVAIIGLLAAIAIPNYVKSRATAQRNACIKNLQQIDGAKEAWGLEQKKSVGTPAPEDQINPYIKGGVTPQCPAGGTYAYQALDTLPSCTIATHTLADSASSTTTTPLPPSGGGGTSGSGGGGSGGSSGPGGGSGNN